MDCRSDDEDLERKLDLEYRRILRTIKIYIPSITNNSFLSSYRVWLEKLSETDSSKKVRNCYLLELCRQIQDGMLEAPFLYAPPSGPLVSLNEMLKVSNTFLKKGALREIPKVTFVKQPPVPFITQNKGNSKQESLNLSKSKKQNQEEMHFENYLSNLSKHSNLPKNENKITEQNQTNFQTPSMVQRSSIMHKKRTQRTIFQKRVTENVGNEPAFQTEEPAKPIFQETQESYYATLAQNQQQYVKNHTYLQHEQQKNAPCYQQPQKSRNVVYYEAVLPQDSESLYLPLSEDTPSEPQKLLKNMPQQQNQRRTDDSSWCDLSEISKTVSRMDSGDSARSSESQENGQNLQTATLDATNKAYDSPITELINVIMELKKHNIDLTTKAEIAVRNLSDEIKSLKNKLHKIGDVKIAHKNNQLSDISQLQSVIENLSKRLLDAQTQNRVLTSEVEDLNKKLEELSVQKQQELAVVRQRLSELYNKEIEMMKQNYVRQIVGIESKFANMLVEKEDTFAKKINDIKEFYDRKFFNANGDMYQ